MILKETSETSFIIFAFRYLHGMYNNIEQKTAYVYHQSKFYNLMKGFKKKIKIYLKYCFFGRITEARQKKSQTLDNSYIIQHLTNYYKRSREKNTYYLKTSLVITLLKDLKNDTSSSPVKIISIIIFSAITINIILSFIFQQQINLWGWMIRGLFLLFSGVGLFIKTNWLTMKKNSVFLKKI